MRQILELLKFVCETEYSYKTNNTWELNMETIKDKGECLRNLQVLVHMGFEK